MIPGSIRMFSGKMVNLLDPKPDDICLHDIAHHLTNECRWGGACDPFFSVAEHSIWTMWLVIQRNAHAKLYAGTDKAPMIARLELLALLHDAHEAYMKDIPKPLKHLFGDRYSEICCAIDSAIYSHFNIKRPEPWEQAIIKDADELCWQIESFLFTRGPHMCEFPTKLMWNIEESLPANQDVKRRFLLSAYKLGLS